VKQGDFRSGPSTEWGSGSHSSFGAGIGFEELSEAGAEFAVEDGAANLEQEISTAPGPTHLLGFGHTAVDQEVGGCFGRRGANPQTGAMTFSVVDQPSALIGEIAVDLASSSCWAGAESWTSLMANRDAAGYAACSMPQTSCHA
jgi:hypothetical protein